MDRLCSSILCPNCFHGRVVFLCTKLLERGGGIPNWLICFEQQPTETQYRRKLWKITTCSPYVGIEYVKYSLHWRTNARSYSPTDAATSQLQHWKCAVLPLGNAQALALGLPLAPPTSSAAWGSPWWWALGKEAKNGLPLYRRGRLCSSMNDWLWLPNQPLMSSSFHHISSSYQASRSPLLPSAAHVRSSLWLSQIRSYLVRIGWNYAISRP